MLFMPVILMVVYVLAVLLQTVTSLRTGPPPPPLPNPGMVFPGDGRHTGGYPSMPGSTDCAIRQAAYAYGRKLQPQKGAFQDLFDALQLGNGCGLPPPSSQAGDKWMPPQAGAHSTPSGERVLFVEPWTTADAGGAAVRSDRLPAGTFSTVADAVAASRSMRKPLTIALREGTHYLSETIHLGHSDSGLTLRNADGENAVLSGGKPLSPAWKPSNACIGCFEALLRGQVVDVPGLRKDGVREIRARYPNHDPELNAFIEGKYLVHDGRAGLLNLTKVNASTWIPAGATMNGMNESWPPVEPATTYVIDGTDWPGVDWPDHIMSTNRSDPTAPLIPDRDTWTGEGDWGQYWLGIGGPCADRSPPAGYWCAPRAPRRISQPGHAAGIVLSATQLPNFPCVTRFVAALLEETMKISVSHIICTCVCVRVSAIRALPVQSSTHGERTTGIQTSLNSGRQHLPTAAMPAMHKASTSPGGEHKVERGWCGRAGSAVSCSCVLVYCFLIAVALTIMSWFVCVL